MDTQRGGFGLEVLRWMYKNRTTCMSPLQLCSSMFVARGTPVTPASARTNTPCAISSCRIIHLTTNRERNLEEGLTAECLAASSVAVRHALRMTALLGPFVIPISDFVAGECDSARALVGVHC